MAHAIDDRPKGRLYAATMHERKMKEAPELYHAGRGLLFSGVAAEERTGVAALATIDLV